MFFNRFDIAEAYYLFLGDYHEGQFSEKYERLCKMGQYFKPRPALSYETLEENGQAIYDALVAKEAYREAVRDVMRSETLYYT